MRVSCDGSGFLDCYCAGDHCRCGFPPECPGCDECCLQDPEPPCPICGGLGCDCPEPDDPAPAAAGVPVAEFDLIR
jgi:hypothetical protein